MTTQWLPAWPLHGHYWQLLGGRHHGQYQGPKCACQSAALADRIVMSMPEPGCWIYQMLFLHLLRSSHGFAQKGFPCASDGNALKGAQMLKNSPAIQETQVQSLGQEDLLEKGMATHSNILTWRFPWTEEPGGLQSMESQKIRHNWVTNTFAHNILKISTKSKHFLLIFSLEDLSIDVSGVLMSPNNYCSPINLSV